MKHLHLLFASLLIITISISSCSKHPGFKKGPDGILYKHIVHNSDSSKVEVGDLLTLTINYWLNLNGKDTLFFDSSSLNIVTKIELLEPEYKGDIYQAIGTMHVGDSTHFIINAKDFFVKTMRSEMPSFIDSTTNLFFSAKIYSSLSSKEMQEADSLLKMDLKSTETQRLNNFLTSNNITSTPSDSGYIIHFLKEGDGRKIVDGDFLDILLTILSIDGKEIFKASDKNQPVTIEVGKPVDTRGFDMAIKDLKKGSIANIVVPSNLAFGENGYKNPNTGEYIIQPFSPIAYYVEVLNVKTKAEIEKELKEIEQNRLKQLAQVKKQELESIKTLVANSYPNAKMQKSGLYHSVTKEGTGAKPQANQKVKVHYTGKLINGSVFDSSVERGQPFEFTLGKGEVIRGWDEGIALMKKGEKAVLIIPSELGYGERQVSPQIPANSTLIFDVELIDIIN